MTGAVVWPFSKVTDVGAAPLSTDPESVTSKVTVNSPDGSPARVRAKVASSPSVIVDFTDLTDTTVSATSGVSLSWTVSVAVLSAPRS